MISVVIVDDHAILRAGIRSRLEREPDITVVGEATNAEQAIERCAALTPHVVLLDLLLPAASRQRGDTRTSAPLTAISRPGPILPGCTKLGTARAHGRSGGLLVQAVVGPRTRCGNSTRCLRRWLRRAFPGRDARGRQQSGRARGLVRARARRAPTAGALDTPTRRSQRGCSSRFARSTPIARTSCSNWGLRPGPSWSCSRWPTA